MLSYLKEFDLYHTLIVTIGLYLIMVVKVSGVYGKSVIKSVSSIKERTKD